MSPLLRRLGVVVAVAIALFFAGSALRARLGLDLALDVEGIRRLAEGMGPVAPLLFVLVVAARALLWLPSQVVLVAAGLCFGTALGALVGGAGLMLSGVALFLLARYAGRDAVEGMIGRRRRALLEIAAKRRGAVVLALASGYPLAPLSPLQAGAGLTAMPLASFIPAAFVGGTVRAATYAFFGDAIIDLERHEIVAALVLVLIVVALPLALPGGRSWLHAFLSDAETAEPARSPTPGDGGGRGAAGGPGPAER
ncbi:MAG: VTT domain-containing protein [Myxococcota bacterium]